MLKILVVLLFCITGFGYAIQTPVVASFSILADVVRQIGGNKVQVTAIVGANQDAHDYELKPSDIMTINHSKLFVINGLGLEAGWMSHILKSYKGHLVVASSGIVPLSIVNDDHKILDDPHIWNDPLNVANYYVPNILAGLIAVDPNDKEYFISNAKQYTQKLTGLNRWVSAELTNIPLNCRQAITTHDAFAYFARQYKIKFLSAQGVSTGSEATAKDIANLEKLIKSSNVKVVFLENMTNNQLIKQVANDTQAKVCGRLYSDALSGNNQPADTYINMIKYNLGVLSTCLRSCSISKRTDAD